MSCCGDVAATGIGAAVRAGPAARLITGVDLPVDGGRTAFGGQPPL